MGGKSCIVNQISICFQVVSVIIVRTAFMRFVPWDFGATQLIDNHVSEAFLETNSILLLKTMKIQIIKMIS